MFAYRIAYRLAVAAVSLTLVAPAGAQTADPPDRVGRLASTTGTVSYHLAGADRWEAAALNLPLTSGAAVWTEPSARAAIDVGSNRITLDSTTEFDLDRLQDRLLQATQPQGNAYIRLREVPDGDTYAVATPRGIAVFARVGRYEVVAGDVEHPTRITVVEGSAQLTGIPTQMQIGPNQTVTITGDGTNQPFTPVLGPVQRDAFLTAMLATERPIQRRAPAYVAQMTGSEALDQYGEWSTSPEYGAIWYPPADPNFVPYRNGHWAYVEPWGWTWVDNAPWGFAPTHYGRWADIGGRWAWIPGAPPGPEARPVYAPALVGFLAGAAAGSLVSWAPLGPHEPYRPPYQASPRYLQEVNRFNARDPAALNAPPQLVNRAAATSVPPDIMTGSWNVRSAARPLPPHLLQGPAEVQSQPPVQPTPATAGFNGELGRRLGIQGGAPSRPAAPGPAIHAQLPPPRPGTPAPPSPSAATAPNTATVGGAAAAGAIAGAAAGALLRPRVPDQPGAMPDLRPNSATATHLGPGAPGPAIVRPASPAQATVPGAIQPGAPRPTIVHPVAPSIPATPIMPEPARRPGGPAPAFGHPGAPAAANAPGAIAPPMHNRAAPPVQASVPHAAAPGAIAPFAARPGAGMPEPARVQPPREPFMSRPAPGPPGRPPAARPEPPPTQMARPAPPTAEPRGREERQSRGGGGRERDPRHP